MKMIYFILKLSVTVLIVWNVLVAESTLNELPNTNNNMHCNSSDGKKPIDNITQNTNYDDVLQRTLTNASVEHPEILPALAEYTLTSDSTEDERTFTCRGNVPVKWFFERYDGNIFKTESLSTGVFSKDRNRNTYLTLLALSRATYLDTGYYYCAPSVVELQLIKEYQNIYIFVQHETHLFASPGDFNKWYITEADEIIIPCRPTSPDVNIKLTTASVNNNTNFMYDKKLGFMSNRSSIITFDNYYCIAKRNGITEKREFTVSTKNLIKISEAYSKQSKHITDGQNVTLNCSSKALGHYYMKWNIPEKLKNQAERVHISKQYFRFNEPVSIQLNIQNVTSEDDGDYSCETYAFIRYQSFVYIETYSLQVNPSSGTYLKLKILNDKNLIIIPVGRQSVQWTIQVSSNPNAVLEWKGPNDNGLDTISEKIQVKTDHGSTELVIRDPQVSDSGVYKLTANNKAEQKEINVTLLVKDLEILPDLTEHTLTSNSTEADRTLVCKGNEPAEWYFEQYDGFILKKKSSLIKVPSKDPGRYTYLTLLSLSKATYMDTGYYYCAPKSVEAILFKDFKYIYIFVQHETHLFAIPDDSYMYETDNNDIVIPCRPTSPDTNVLLFVNHDGYDSNTNLTGNFYYDKKKGFVTYEIWVFATYICVAQKNDVFDIRRFNFHHEDDVVFKNVISGQSMTLNCSISFHFNSTLKWIVPDRLKNESERVQCDEERTFYFESGGIALNVQNVTAEDEDYYVCVLTDNYYDSDQWNRSYRLIVKAPNETDLDLSIPDGTDTLIRPAGYHIVDWKVQVSARPNAILEWRDPDGNRLRNDSEKMYVINDSGSSRLVIRDLQLCDSGAYTLIANNTFHIKEINVLLLVEEKPSIEFQNSTNSGELYCELGKICVFEFHISGYPLPEVEWSFQNRTNNTIMRQQSYRQLQYIKNDTKSLSPVAQMSLITINGTESVTLICNATNQFGNAVKQYTVWLSDEFNDFDIKGPSFIVAGDNVTLVCGASKYNYLNEIKWIYPKENLNKKRVSITESEKEFSHRSYLTIEKISSDLNVSCLVNRKTQSNSEWPETVTKSFALRVKESYGPAMNSSLTSIILQQIMGEPLELWCLVVGMPSPTVSWFKDDEPLRLDETTARMFLKNRNQTLFIKLTKLEDEGTYVCNATNRVGSAILTYYLTFDYDNTLIGDIVLNCILTILLVVLISGGVLWIKTKWKLRKRLAEYRKEDFVNGTVKSWNPHLGVEEQAHLLPYDNRWEFPIDKLELGEQIGSGAFGIVYKAKATGILDQYTTTTVAVKTVKPSTDPSHRTALASELKIMIHLGRHLNIVNVLGACTGNISRKLMVIVEYCRFGSIDGYIQKHRGEFINQVTADGFIDYTIDTVSDYANFSITETHDIVCTPIDSDGYLVAGENEPERHYSYHGDFNKNNREPLCTKDLLCWAFQVARGMEYLASRKILHGDLATRNILLDDDNIVKICDFGLAKNMYKGEIYKKSKKTRLPIKWLAIESICDGIFSTSSDVWSFGIVLWEMFSLAALPYPNIQVENLLDRLCQGYRMEQPQYSNAEMYNLMLECWRRVPNERPTFTDLAVRLGDLLQECTKTHYVELNVNYVRMTNERLPNTDSLGLLSAPTYSNYNSLTACGSHTETNRINLEHSVDMDNVELKPIMFHNTGETKHVG